jgi:hypothetical protein
MERVAVPNLKKYLLRPENLTPLEDSLDFYGQKWSVFKKKEDSLDFGRVLRSQEKAELFDDVIKRVDRLTGVSDISRPKLDEFSKRGLASIMAKSGAIPAAILALNAIDGFGRQDLEHVFYTALVAIPIGALFYLRLHATDNYVGSYRTVNVNNLKPTSASTLAHEYTHHLQHELTSFMSDSRSHRVEFSSLIEGHAMAVGQAIGSDYANEFDNSAYEYKDTELTATLLMDAYLRVCRSRKIDPRESLLFKELKTNYSEWNTDMYPYVLGRAAFCGAESRSGDRIFCDPLKGDLSFLC